MSPTSVSPKGDQDGPERSLDSSFEDSTRVGVKGKIGLDDLLDGSINTFQDNWMNTNRDTFGSSQGMDSQRDQRGTDQRINRVTFRSELDQRHSPPFSTSTINYDG